MMSITSNTIALIIVALDAPLALKSTLHTPHIIAMQGIRIANDVDRMATALIAGWSILNIPIPLSSSTLFQPE